MSSFHRSNPRARTFSIALSLLSSLSLLTSGCTETPQAHSGAPRATHQCKTPLSERDVTLDPDEVYELVSEYDELISNCYNQALDANPTLQGRIEVNLIVGTDGVPAQLCSGTSTLPNSRVVSCVLHTFSRFRFHERDEAEAGIYPITFAPD